jgi:hypothetical protein
VTIAARLADLAVLNFPLMTVAGPAFVACLCYKQRGARGAATCSSCYPGS